jgi:hypothetical protein
MTFSRENIGRLKLPRSNVLDGGLGQVGDATTSGFQPIFRKEQKQKTKQKTKREEKREREIGRYSYHVETVKLG